ncbi:hypothetical protein, partial [Geobacillus sp. ZGt-1]|uniref:hypothetical protein n=1 Tax=Geobacillus sp. ZGt-1 TaxID=1631556 RepID=UPI001F2B6D69
PASARARVISADCHAKSSLLIFPFQNGDQDIKNGRNRAQSHFSQSIMDSVKTDRSPPLFLEFHEWNVFHSLFLLIESLG